VLSGAGHRAATVSVRTITGPGTTVQQTVTAPPASTAAQPPTTTAPPAAQSGDALNAQGYDLLKRGDYSGALPLLQQAVQKLQGQTSDVNDAYANYNLGVTLIALHQCAQAMPYLQTAKQLEPSRHEVHDALKLARKCG
jgi:Flp pilus assembly protein TadD